MSPWGDGKIELKALKGDGSIKFGEKQASGKIAAPSSGLDESAGTAATTGRYHPRRIFGEIVRILKRYAKFVGPGFMVAVAYIDPGKLFWQLSTHTECHSHRFSTREPVPSSPTISVSRVPSHQLLTLGSSPFFEVADRVLQETMPPMLPPVLLSAFDFSSSS